MNESRVFFDTNILLYLLSEDTTKADQAEKLVSQQGIISVQVLNKFTSVACRKLQMEYPEIQEILSSIRSICKVKPVDVETHDLGLQIAQRYKFSFYDSLIVASALLANCHTLYTEDLQNGQKIENKLTIVNPFRIQGE